MATVNSHRRSAWIAAGLLATLSLIIAATAADAQQAPAVAPTANGASRSNARTTQAPSPPARPQPDRTKPEDARDSQRMVPEDARDPQVMVPESARDPQVMVPESAHD